MGKFKPVVASIHGFISHAHWQKKFSEVVTANGFLVANCDYGVYIPIIFNRQNDKLIDKFYGWYCRLIDDKKFKLDIEKPYRRPSIVCHSLGSFIVGHAMMKYPDITFDKIILCGSILPEDFDWETLFERDQVNEVRNEYGLKDKIISKYIRFVRRAGKSGVNGFEKNANIEQALFKEFKHSDYFKGEHIKNHWCPFLRRQSNYFEIKHGSEIRKLVDFKTYFSRTGAMDVDEFRDLRYDEVTVTESLALSWVRSNSDIYSFLLDAKTKQVIGYINAMPVSEETYKKISEGDLQDNEILPSDILSYEKVRFDCYLYIVSIVIDKNYRNHNVGLMAAPMKLINSLVEKIKNNYQLKQIRIKRIIAVGWTPEGTTYCEIFGMKKIGKDKKLNKPIYEIDLEEKGLNNNKSTPKQIRRIIKSFE